MISDGHALLSPPSRGGKRGIIVRASGCGVCVGAFARVILFAAIVATANVASRRAIAAPPRAPLSEPPHDSLPESLSARRYELAGFPVLGGNSDIGFQFGGAATYTRFYDTAFPYMWNVDLLLSASVKDDANGFRMVQQSHVVRLDAPALFGGKMRLDAKGTFQRTINAGYYGIGNASQAGLPPGEKAIGRRYQYLHQEGRVRAIGRWHTATPLDVAVGSQIRYDAPDSYGGSKLAEDLAAGKSTGAAVVGGESALLASLSAGVILDTRDSEFVTGSGFFYQVGIGATVGSAREIAYGEASAVLAHYAPLGGPFIFASRFIASLQLGRVPFFDLQQGGTFEPQMLFGGESGVRGVPQGRYAGRMKMAANTEIRATPFPRFLLLGQRMRIGTSTFVDVGRVWSDYSAVSPADGNKLALKYGIGGGLFLQWGEAAIFRVEVAYSPDAVSENPGFPMGIYVSDGLMF